MNFILIQATRDRLAKVMLVLALATFVLFVTGVVKLNLNIEFTGGVVHSLSAPVSLTKEALGANTNINISGSAGGSVIQMAPEHTLADGEQQFIDKYSMSVDTIGASLGTELINASVFGVTMAFLGVMIYLSVRYNYIMASATIIALVHDILFTLFILTIFGIQMSSIVVGAILAIIGYSINDSVVTLDRVRELARDNIENPIQRGLEMTLQRNINTAVSTLIVVVALFVFGGAPLQAFSLTMLAGVGIGMLSSLTIVPCLVSVKEKSGALNVSYKPSLDGEL